MSGSDVAIVKSVCPSDSQTPGKIHHSAVTPCTIPSSPLLLLNRLPNTLWRTNNSVPPPFAIASIAEKVGDVVPFNITTHTLLRHPGDAKPFHTL
jgi:hypothetical protein